jgi:uncharacterized protein (DUF362 family)/Pyruvate/2-oxoacid:ferredoxin oxidoreductase delta subunit
VLIKPNVINPKPPESAVCTHPTVVRAVAEIACEAGCTVLVADEPGYAMTGVPEEVFGKAGILAALEGLPVEVDLLKRGGYRKIQIADPLRVPEVAIATRALDADLIINLPKCKTHQQTLLTGAVKNMFGTVAPRQRIQTHMVGTASALAEALADTFSACVPQVNLMDAVMGMEGKGPSNGTPRPIGAILASEDAVALDAVVESMTGFRPGEVELTVAAARKGLGENDLSQISVVGDNPARFLTPLKRAPGGVRHGFPGWVGKLIQHAVYVRPCIIPDRCISCGACKGICPGEAIQIAGIAVIDYARCLECFCCQEVCPKDAIDTRSSWLARKLVSSSLTRQHRR